MLHTFYVLHKNPPAAALASSHILLETQHPKKTACTPTQPEGGGTLLAVPHVWHTHQITQCTRHMYFKLLVITIKYECRMHSKHGPPLLWSRVEGLSPCIRWDTIILSTHFTHEHPFTARSEAAVSPDPQHNPPCKPNPYWPASPEGWWLECRRSTST